MIEPNLGEDAPGVPPERRARSTMSGSTSPRPVTELTKIGNIASRKAMTTLDSISSPNQITRSGAMAIFGMPLNAASIGIMIARSVLK